VKDPTTQVRMLTQGRMAYATSDYTFDDEQLVQWFRNGMPEMWRILARGALSKAHVPKHLVPEVKALFLAQGYEFVSQEQSKTLANRDWLVFCKPLEAAR
jgi:hypothetical protein